MATNPGSLVKVVELFKSIEGEGIRAGASTTFVRFFGCNLSCSWCDTLYAREYSQENEDTCTSRFYTREELATEIISRHCKYVTFTGGEPLIHSLGKLEFIEWFCASYPEYEVNIETNGSRVVPNDLHCRDNVIITMDYKCPSSGMTDKMSETALRSLTYKDALKFVVANEVDLQETIRVLMKYRPGCHIFVNPVFGQMDLQRLAEFVIKHDFLNIRLGLQLHKIIWEPNRRGV